MHKYLVGVLIIFVIFLCYSLDMHHYISLEQLKTNLHAIQRLASDYQWRFAALFFLFYVVITAFSLPGAAIMTLAAGAIFGFSRGTIIVSFASTIGATFAFLVARYVLRDFVERKFSQVMKPINAGVNKEGAFYLFALRLIPVFPFFLINLAMGLTNISTKTFYWVSQVGMLAGTMAYVNAGMQLATIDSVKGILSPSLLLSFAIIGFFPLITKRLVEWTRGRRVYAPFRSKKPRKVDYDMVVIGGGAAGLVTAYISAAVKARVALIEEHKMGGDCLYTGCVPSKALIRSAHLLHDAKNCKKFGIRSMNVEVDFSDLMARVHQVIKKIEPHDSIQRYSALGVECVSSKAIISSPWTVDVGGRVLTTRNITISCGAAPLVPPISGLDSIEYLTSESIWQLKECPKHLLVLGGGPVGCELAQCFSRLGAKVTIVEMLDRIMPGEDSEVSAAIRKRFEHEGIHVLTGHKAVSFARKHGDLQAICEYQGNPKELIFDQVLIAVGRTPRTKGYGLEELGLDLRPDGTIAVNEYLQTKYPNIFACGDVTGPYQFTHTAAHQAWFCAVNGLFGSFKRFKVDYRVIPWCTYTDPEIATVGLTEETARQQGIAYELTRYNLDDLDRAIADSADYGFVKVLTIPGKDKVLGATIVGTQASNLILEFVSAMKHGFGLNKILGTIHVYPSMGEANKYAAGIWRKAHTSPKILRMLEQYFRWRKS